MRENELEDLAAQLDDEADAVDLDEAARARLASWETIGMALRSMPQPEVSEEFVRETVARAKPAGSVINLNEWLRNAAALTAAAAIIVLGGLVALALWPALTDPQYLAIGPGLGEAPQSGAFLFEELPELEGETVFTAQDALLVEDVAALIVGARFVEDVYEREADWYAEFELLDAAEQEAFLVMLESEDNERVIL